jgi:hypothetical protein
VHGPMTHQDINLLPYFLHVHTHKYLLHSIYLWFIFTVVFLFLHILF